MFRVAASAAVAEARGCDLATVAAAPGGASQRNIERAGFAVVYTRVSLERATPRS
jgi:hypothetical protein